VTSRLLLLGSRLSLPGAGVPDETALLADALERAGYQISRSSAGAPAGPSVVQQVATVLSLGRWADAIVVEAQSGGAMWTPFVVARIARLFSRPAIVMLCGEDLAAYADRHPRRTSSTLQLATCVASASRSLRQHFEESGQVVTEVPSAAFGGGADPSVDDDVLVSWDSTLTRCGVTRIAPPANGCGPLASSDLSEVIDIHRASFPDSAITQLGDAVIRRYYAWQFIGPHPAPVAIGVWADGRLVGFLFGGRRQRAVVGFVHRYVGAIALGAVRHPGAVRRLAAPKVVAVVKLLARGRAGHPSGSAAGAVAPVPAPSAGGPSFGVLSVAVAAAARGTGAAQQLMHAAELAASADGLSRMHLTVQTENGRAVAFYEKLGWERKPDADGWHGAMTKSIAPVGAGAHCEK